MKNRKIIYITIALVAAVLVGMVGMSNFFETSWQKPEETDNSLSAEVTGTSDESVFDYPFKHMNQLTDKELFDLQLDYCFDYTIDSLSGDMISYQHAANIAGEALKFLYGCTDQQSDCMIIDLLDIADMYADRDFDVYKEQLFHCTFETKYGENEKLFFHCLIEPYTGEIIYCTAKDYRDLTEYTNAEMTYWPTQEITENYKQNIVKKAQDVLDIVKPDSSVKQLKKFDYSAMSGHGRVFNTTVELADGTLVKMMFDEQYNNNNQLAEYFIPYTSAMEEVL